MNTVFIHGLDGNLVYEGVIEETPIAPIVEEFDPLTNSISISVSPPGMAAAVPVSVVPMARAMADHNDRLQLDIIAHEIYRILSIDYLDEPCWPRTSHTLSQRGIQIGLFGGLIRSEHRMRVRGPLSDRVWRKRALQLGMAIGYGYGPFCTELKRWEIHDRGYRSYWET